MGFVWIIFKIHPHGRLMFVLHSEALVDILD